MRDWKAYQERRAKHLAYKSHITQRREHQRRINKRFKKQVYYFEVFP